MRAILIDPATKTITEIQIKDSDDHNEQCNLIMSPRHREAAEKAVNGGERSGEELFGGHWELNRDKTGSEGIIVNGYMFDDEPGFILDNGDERDIVHGRALAMRSEWEMGTTTVGDVTIPTRENWTLADLKISVEELTKRITFT